MTRTISPLFLTAFLVGSDEFLLGPILTPIGADLGVEPARVALFVGAYALPLAFLAPVLGGLSDRFGRRRILTPSMIVFGLGSLATSFADSYELALASRVVTGFGAAGMLPVAFAIAADSSEHSSLSIAAVQSGLTLGIITSPAYGAWVTANFGWQAAFSSLAVATVVALLLSLNMPQLPVRRGPATLFAVLRTRGAISAVLAMFLGLGGAVGVFAMTGERLRDLTGVDTELIGPALAGFGLLTLVGNFGMPWLEARVASRTLFISLCLGAVGAAIGVLFGLRPGILMSLGALAVWAVLGGAGAPALQAHIAGLSEEHRGLLMALASSALNLGIALWSAVASDLFSRAPHWVAVQAALTIGGAVIALNLARATRKTAPLLESGAAGSSCN